MRLLFCRHEDCGRPYESHAGKIPPICPACHRSALWATEPHTPTVDVAGHALTAQDRRFLKALRIQADET